MSSIKEYNPNKVQLSLRVHTGDCDTYKSTFTHWVEISREHLPDWDKTVDGSLYGDYLREYYKDDKLVAKMLTQQSITTFSRYFPYGVGVRYECTCDNPYLTLDGFARDTNITIKKEK